MAKQSIDQLKQWFQTQDFPTQQQFYDWMESYYHLDSEIPINKVTGLTTQLQAINNALANINIGGDGGGLPPVVLINESSWTAPAGTMVDDYVGIDDVDTVISAGTTPGATDIFNSVTFSPGDNVYTRKKYFKDEQTIFFTGKQPTTVIIIFRR